MRNSILVFDFETTGLEAGTDKCDPVELAACAIHTRYLKPIKDSEFSIMIRPDNIEDPNYYEDHKSTMDWHCRLKKCKPEDLIEEWKKGVPEKKAWKMFAEYVNQYNYANRTTTAPIPAGTNIRGFDLLIYDYLNTKHKVKPCFHKRDVVDLKDLCLLWFSFSSDAPPNYKMDTLRDYLGLATEGAHEAIVDVRQEAEIICEFLSKHKKFGSKINWRGSMAKGA